MEGERHLLSNHADIDRSYHKQRNRTFPAVESFRDEQKICLKNFVWGKDVFAILPTGFGDFSTLSISNERNGRKSWLINFNDHHRCASRSHNERQSEFISDVIFINGRETNFWKFAGDVTYTTQKTKTNLQLIHRDARRTTSVVPLVTSPHCNRHRQLWYVTRAQVRDLSNHTKLNAIQSNRPGKNELKNHGKLTLTISLQWKSSSKPICTSL